MAIKFALLALAALPLMAQQSQNVFVQPNCTINFTFTTATSTIPTPGGTNGDNRSTACNSWLVSYSNSGFSALTLTLQSAPNSSGSPGSWVTYAGATAVVGTNPATSTTEISFCIVGYNPWVRVNLSGLTGSGTVTGNALGFANYNICGGNGAPAPPPTGTTDVNLVEVAGTAVLTGGVAGSQGVGGLAAVGATPAGNPIPAGVRNSAGIYIPDYCTSKATFTTSGSGNTQMVAVSGSTTIRICHVDWTGDTLTIAKIVSGTGATCTSPADETGVFTGQGGGMYGFVMDYVTGPLPTTAAKTLCINLSIASAGGGTIIYSQR